jgi:HEPN domain-containing protein
MEKLLKAHVTIRTRVLAPRIHNLLRLAEMSGMDFSPDERTLLEHLSLYYLQSRYPPEIQALAKATRQVMATRYLRQTEALWKRLRRRLTRQR